jgi:putative oxidoreductase
MRDLLRMAPVPASQDAGLLALRVAGVLPLLLKHGLEKVFTFSAMAAHFPDPLHIGPVPSLLFAMLSDAICTVLLILGLATRWAALVCLINLGVAWAFVHHFQFFGRGADHGEVMVVYMAIMLTLLLAGAGKYSMDALLRGDGRKN